MMKVTTQRLQCFAKHLKTVNYHHQRGTTLVQKSREKRGLYPFGEELRFFAARKHALGQEKNDAPTVRCVTMKISNIAALLEDL